MKLVLEEPGIDRTLLSKATGLTNAAMTRIVQELIAAGIIKDTGVLDSDGSRGRRRSGLQIDSTGGYVLGLCILAFNSSVALSDLTGKTIEVVRVEPTDISDPVKTLDEISNAALALLKKHKVEANCALGAGVAITGYMSQSGEVTDSSPYLGWPDFDIRGSLLQRLNVRVAVDNVNRCIAVAENRVGSCVGVQDFVLLRAAIGIGGAFVSNGDLVRGSNNRAGHIGHSCVQPDGLACTCGALGCLNTVASGWAILNQLDLVKPGKSGVRILRSQEAKLRRALSSKNESNLHYQSVIRTAGEALANHCHGMLQALNPAKVLLTGPLGRNSAYCEGFQETLQRKNVQTNILTAYENNITDPASAAAILALAKHVYSSSLDIQPLLDNQDRRGEDLKEGLL